MIAGISFLPRSRRLMRGLSLTALVMWLLASASPVVGASNSARYRWEGNQWLSLDVAVGDVRADMIKFEWPSTIMGIKTGHKASVKIVNGSAHQTSIGLAIALYDEDSRLIGVGSVGTTIGTIDPGDSAEFNVTFNHTTERLNRVSQFHILLESR